jgi:hypothetical protein
MDGFLDKEEKMDNVQEHSNHIDLPSPLTFRSDLHPLYSPSIEFPCRVKRNVVKCVLHRLQLHFPTATL